MESLNESSKGIKMGLQNIVQKQGLERRDAPVGYDTWSNYIDARLEDVADRATERL